jgi:hypothetical protein
MSNDTPRIQKRDAAAILALALSVLVIFWKIALTNRVLVGLDVFAYFYPYRDFVSAALRAGQLPLWNPYLFMGAPLLANSQAAVLYPLHWPLIWLSTPKQISWSIVLHVWLAAAGTYLFARTATRLRPGAALVAAIVFGLGGFLGAQVEHVNQLNASAWLPWLLLCLEGAMGRGRHRVLSSLGGAAVVGLALLAGHTQAAYIVLVGAGIYALARGLEELRAAGGRRWLAALKGIGLLLGMGVMGVLLAAGQLLPTLELSGLSVRGAGLPYNIAASFSLKPQLVFKAFLPPLAWPAPYSEYVAYVGLIGLALAALGAWATLRRIQLASAVDGAGIVPSAARSGGLPALALALLGVFLAFGAYNPFYYLLYKVVPGFDLFRAPARWLLLYSFGAAILAGIGLQALPRLPGSRRARLQAGLVVLLAIELFVASRRLALNHPTAPAAFDSMRTAPAHLLADASGQPFRFLSMSDLRYDPGDLADLQSMYGPSLPESEIYELVVATKMKEVLDYNLPLRYRLSSVDGYDGGLLPIADYVTLERLFLAEEDIWADGRLGQQLRRVPPVRLLSLLNVKYVITDKVQDVWIDDVYYDLEHTVPLGELTLADLPDFEATHLGVVSYLTGTTDVVDGTPVARVTVAGPAGALATATLRAGEDTAEGLYGPGPVSHSQARVGHRWGQEGQGSDYAAVLALGRPLQPETISLRSLLTGGQVHLRGLALIDDRTGTSRVLSVDPAYRLVHSGDVKIYQNLALLPRAFVVHRASVIRDEDATLALLSDPAFDPARQAILDGGRDLDAGAGVSGVELVVYEPERIQIRVALDTPGYLLLTDTHYPGWVAHVDGQPVSLRRADLYFRAVALEAGQHQVSFRFEPASVRWGLGVGLASWLLWGLAFAVVAVRIGRRGTSGV